MQIANKLCRNLILFINTIIGWETLVLIFCKVDALPKLNSQMLFLNSCNCAQKVYKLKNSSKLNFLLLKVLVYGICDTLHSVYHILLQKYGLIQYCITIFAR